MDKREYIIRTPGKGCVESIGWAGIFYSRNVKNAFAFPCLEDAQVALEALPEGSAIIPY